MTVKILIKALKGRIMFYSLKTGKNGMSSKR